MAASLNVVDAAGKKTGSVDLPAELFDVQTNVPLLHQVVVAQLAAARQGTHSTKGRGEVSGAGRKPFKQKGTGRARQGSIRAPQMTGGGIVHGPTPRNYAQRTLAAVASGRNVLVVIERGDDVNLKSVRNLRNLHVISPDQLNAYDVLVSDDIVFTKTAFEAFVSAKTKKEEVSA